MARDWFVDRLQTVLWVEETLAREVIPLLLEHATGNDLLYGLERHRLETKEHALAVRAILDRLGERADPQPTAELPAPELGHGDLGIAETVAKTEHLEIAAYTALRSVANALGEEEIGLRLQEVLEQEQYALELAEKALAKLLAELVTNA
jgi:ferritin-like metal-binding protein YciE